MYGAMPSTPYIPVDFSGEYFDNQDAELNAQCFPSVPRIGDKIEYFKESFIVKDVIWVKGKSWRVRLLLESQKEQNSPASTD